jgi:hypothetical protein
VEEVACGVDISECRIPHHRLQRLIHEREIYFMQVKLFTYYQRGLLKNQDVSDTKRLAGIIINDQQPPLIG